jgi:hypothetical protein
VLLVVLHDRNSTAFPEHPNLSLDVKSAGASLLVTLNFTHAPVQFVWDIDAQTQDGSGSLLQISCVAGEMMSLIHPTLIVPIARPRSGVSAAASSTALETEVYVVHAIFNHSSVMDGATCTVWLPPDAAWAFPGCSNSFQTRQGVALLLIGQTNSDISPKVEQVSAGSSPLSPVSSVMVNSMHTLSTVDELDMFMVRVTNAEAAVAGLHRFNLAQSLFNSTQSTTSEDGQSGRCTDGDLTTACRAQADANGYAWWMTNLSCKYLSVAMHTLLMSLLF